MSVRASALKRVAKRWARRSFATIGKATSFRKQSSAAAEVRILTYHRVESAPDDPFAVDLKEFTEQLETLASLKGVEPLNTAVSRIGTTGPPASKVVLTFDDGTIDFMRNAWPVLHRFGLPATIYVNPARIGGDGFMSWPDLSELSKMGVEVESHGFEHRSLGRMGRDEVRRQVTESRKILEDRLGKAVTSFAYPYGTLNDFNAMTRDEIRDAGYRSACTSLNGVNTEKADLYELHRTKIERGDGPIFRWILAGHLDGWEWIDRHLSRFQNRYPSIQ